MKFYRPMLAYPGKRADLHREGFLFEPKLDGTRTIVYKEDSKVILINRRGYDITHRYPEFSFKIPTSVLDGEIVVLDKGKPNFYKLQEREHIDDKLRIELLSKCIPATLFVFDILSLRGKELISVPLHERKQILKNELEETQSVKNCLYTHKGEELFISTKQLGLEGVMAKDERSLYYPGKRKSCWLKIKHFDTMDCIICGYTKGKGWREQYFGALLLCAHKGDKLSYLGKVGTGWSDSLLAYITEKLAPLKIDTPLFEKIGVPNVQWVRPTLVCEVQYLELTTDGKLRAPSFKRLKEDKAPDECTI
ncbi:MAG TPA: DNA ligase [bacterium (Candidatus Stahlbacteria)]|nr:DNA ligase [Candidatus Stahlbacteria bacterium]